MTPSVRATRALRTSELGRKLTDGLAAMITHHYAKFWRQADDCDTRNPRVSAGNQSEPRQRVMKPNLRKLDCTTCWLSKPTARA